MRDGAAVSFFISGLLLLYTHSLCHRERSERSFTVLSGDCIFEFYLTTFLYFLHAQAAVAFTFAHSSAKVNKTPFCLGKSFPSVGAPRRVRRHKTNECFIVNYIYPLYSKRDKETAFCEKASASSRGRLRRLGGDSR